MNWVFTLKTRTFGNFLEMILIISQFDVFLSHLKSKVVKVRKDRETKDMDGIAVI